MPPPTGVVKGPLMATRNSRMASTVSSGSHLSNFAFAFFSRENFIPGEHDVCRCKLFPPRH